MSEFKRTQKNDFSKGSVWKCILKQAVPLTVAQLVHLLYNVVDRVYLGHMGEGDSMALTGVGLVFPVVTLIMAFTALFGNGGVPLFAMARGAGNDEKAGRVLGNSFALLLGSAGVLTILGYIFSRDILFAFGASEESYVYAQEYLRIYLAGTVFSMIATGLNGYINAQGFARTGMLSVVIGALVNLVLDPLFIFTMELGVAGAALATVISQAVSAVWVLSFLFGRRALIPLQRKKNHCPAGYHPANLPSRHGKLYHARHKFCRTSCLQHHAAKLRRRSLRRHHDGGHLRPRRIHAAGIGLDPRCTAGDQL